MALKLVLNPITGKFDLVEKNAYGLTSPTNTTVGGLISGTAISGKTWQQIIELMTVAFIQQTGALGVAPSAATIREKGAVIASVVLTATFTNSAAPRYPVTSVVFKRAGSTINTISGADLASPQAYTDSTGLSDTALYQALITNSNAFVTTVSQTYTFVYPIYCGNCAKGDYTGWSTYTQIEAGIARTGGANKLLTAKQNTAVIDTFVTKVNIFMYPASYGSLISILDNSSFETLSNYDVYTKSFTMLDGSSVSYKIYELKNNTSQTSFVNTYKFT